jgi:hypothetical protein
MTAPDFLDWQRPVASAEQFTDFGSWPLLSGSAVNQWLNTAQMQSVDVSVDAPYVSATPLQCQLVWYDTRTGNLIDIDNVTFWGNSDYGSGPMHIRAQVKAPWLYLRVFNSFSGAASVHAWGSTRPFDKLVQCRPSGYAGGKLLVPPTSFALTPGSTQSFKLGPVDRCISFRTSSNQPLIAYNVWGFSQNGVNVTQFPMFGQSMTTNPQYVYELVGPNMALQIDVVSTDTQTRNPGLTVWDSS